MYGTTAISRENRPMHRPGTDVTGARTISDALQLADLDWDLAETSAASILTDDGTVLSMPGKFIYRPDTGISFGLVGDGYRAVPNAEAFDIGRHLLDAGARLDTAGSRDGGAWNWMRFVFPEQAIYLDGKADQLDISITVSAAHGGNGGIVTNLSVGRVICTNGMTTTGFHGVRHVIRHSRNADQQLAEARSVMQDMVRYAKEFTTAAQHMLDTPMTRAEFIAFIDSLFIEPDAEKRKNAHTIWRTRREALSALFTEAETQDFGRGSAWAAYNSVVEYADWIAPIRGVNPARLSDVITARHERIEDGARQDVKDLAFNALVGV